MDKLAVNPEVVNALLELVTHFFAQTADKKTIHSFDESIQISNPMDIIQVVDKIVGKEGAGEQTKGAVDKLIRVLGKRLHQIEFSKKEEPHFLGRLMGENELLKEEVANIKAALKTLNKKDPSDSAQTINEKMAALHQVSQGLSQIGQFECHYVKKENILFPYLEQAMPNPRCLKLMWAYHDDTRQYTKEAVSAVSALWAGFDDEKLKKVNRELGALFFSLFPTILKEHHILFPVCADLFAPEQFAKMAAQGMEVGYFGGETAAVTEMANTSSHLHGHLPLSTGSLNLTQLNLLLCHLPMDISFVDENDTVKYYSAGKERFFSRSPAVIGRKVQNCHPPKSVHTVEQILEAFKSGKKDTAEFWITRENSTLHIRYIAVRDSEQNYLGCLETVQDISDLKKLEGERRLLDW